MTDTPLLRVRNLHTYFDTSNGTVKAVDGVGFDVRKGETVCIVGESGSGKTVTSESITRLFKSPPGYVAEGSIQFDGEEVTEMDDEELRRLRGGRISHIFQNPQGALNPVYTVGWQLKEAITLHQNVTDEEAHEKAVELFNQVGIPEASSRLEDYPHEFSGGMKQRVIIAIALACEPDLLIADEPTTALDVTIQAQILRLLNDLKEDHDMGIIFITHDLGVVAEIANRVVVMYAGKVMEYGDVFDVFESPAHPYTQALLDCLPSRGETQGIPGTLPDVTEPPAGCRFHARCPHAVADCSAGEQPPMHEVHGSEGHRVSCVHFAPDADPSVVMGSKQAATDGGRVAGSTGGQTGGSARDAAESAASCADRDDGGEADE